MGNGDSTINKLEECCKNDNSAKFAELIKPASKGVLQAYESPKNDGGWRTGGAYLLCVAVQMEAIQCLRIILRYVSANVKDKHEQTPLHKAARLRSPNVAKVLLEHVAYVNATDKGGWSPIHQAANGGNVQTLSLLCSVADAHLNLKTGSEGWTPLHIAVDYASNGPECVRILLDFGASADIRDSWNCTARERAVKRGNQDILGLLNKAAVTTPEEPASIQPTATTATAAATTAATAAASSTPKPKEPAAAVVRTEISARSSQSKKGVPTAAVSPEDSERQGNPWKHKRFIETTYYLQDKLTQLGKVRGLCHSLQLIGAESFEQLQLLKSKSEHNQKLLSYLMTGNAESFAKFREVIRHLHQEVKVFAKILKKWDTIGPLKEYYQNIERELNGDD